MKLCIARVMYLCFTISVMRNVTVYYSPNKHEGNFNGTAATYCYDMSPESMTTFANWKNGERVAGLTGKDQDGNWKRFRFENIIRLAGV